MAHELRARHQRRGGRVPTDRRSDYLEQARRFAQMAVDRFFQDRALPRASFKTDHYETITGADSLALALLEVHAAVNDLATVIPANTIDR